MGLAPIRFPENPSHGKIALPELDGGKPHPYLSVLHPEGRRSQSRYYSTYSISRALTNCTCALDLLPKVGARFISLLCTSTPSLPVRRSLRSWRRRCTSGLTLFLRTSFLLLEASAYGMTPICRNVRVSRLSASPDGIDIFLRKTLMAVRVARKAMSSKIVQANNQQRTRASTRTAVTLNPCCTRAGITCTVR